MKKISVYRTASDGSTRATTITAPKDKEMVFDPAMLQHHVLSLGEYGPSGLKIAIFDDWDYAIFEDARDAGYTIKAS